MKVHWPVNKKIIPENTTCSTTSKVCEFKNAQIARFRTSHFKITTSEMEVSELG